MVVNWREISNYIDDDLYLFVRTDMEAHLEQCRHCAAVLEQYTNFCPDRG